MANKLNNRYIQALPEGVKVTTGVQELMRRLRNTSRNRPPINTETVILEYMQELREGGYPLKVRIEMLKAATTGFEKRIA